MVLSKMDNSLSKMDKAFRLPEGGVDVHINHRGGGSIGRHGCL